MTVQYQGVWTLQSAAQLQSTQRWVTDPLYKNTTLLLQADDAANGAQNNTFLDSSSNNFAITRNGNTTQGSFTPFSSQTGAWSNTFNANGGLSITDQAAFQPGTGNFTVEGWVYRTSSTDYQCLFWQGAGGSNAKFRWSILWRTTGWVYMLSQFGGSGDIANEVSMGADPGANRWVHLALVRNGNTFTPYINGIAGPTTTSSATLFTGTSDPFSIGFASVGGVFYPLTGNISNFRLVKGVAVYTGNFAVPSGPIASSGAASASAYSTTTNINTSFAASSTSLMTCQDNRFVDNSNNNFTFTFTGTQTVQPFSPFAPQYQWTPSVIGGSGYFDGSGDYLTAAGNTAFAFGTGDFTVAAWIYPTVATTFTVLSSNYTFATAAGNWSLYFGVGSAQTLYFNSNAVNKQSSVTTTIPLNAWTHVAYSRVGTTARFFVNGVQLGANISDSVNYGGSSGNLFVGQQSDGNGIAYGYMTSIQVLKGTGYSSLPLPTAPATNIANTSFLLNFTNAGIYDGTMKNNLETVGNASVSTAVVKYGSGSMAFDGTGDYLRATPTYNPLLIEWWKGSYTLEFWIYANAINSVSNPIIVSHADPTGPTNFWSFGPVTGGTIQFYYFNGSGNSITTTTAIVTGQWYHLAFVNNNNAIAIYINGVQSATGTVSGTPQSNTGVPFLIGGYNNTSFNGYIDDFRVTRFARYTQNFIPPSVALPRQ